MGSLVNKKTGQVEVVPDEEIVARVNSGEYEQPETVTVRTDSGREVTISYDDFTKRAQLAGDVSVVPLEERTRRAGEEYLRRHHTRGAANTVKTLLEGFASGATGGLINPLLDDEASRARRELDPLYTPAEIGGLVLPAFFTGGGGGAFGSLMRATPSGLLARGGAGVSARLGGGLTGAAAAGALEGGLGNVSYYLSDVALGDRDLSAEGFVGSLVDGSFWGGGAGAAGYALERGFVRARQMFPRRAGALDAKAARGEEHALATKLDEAEQAADEAMEKAKLRRQQLRMEKAEIELAMKQHKLDTMRSLDNVRVEKAKSKAASDQAVEEARVELERLRAREKELAISLKGQKGELDLDIKGKKAASDIDLKTKKVESDIARKDQKGAVDIERAMQRVKIEREAADLQRQIAEQKAKLDIALKEQKLATQQQIDHLRLARMTDKKLRGKRGKRSKKPADVIPIRPDVTPPAAAQAPTPASAVDDLVEAAPEVADEIAPAPVVADEAAPAPAPVADDVADEAEDVVEEVAAPRSDVPTYEELEGLPDDVDFIEATIDPDELLRRDVKSLPDGFDEKRVSRISQARESGKNIDPVQIALRPDGSFDVVNGRHRIIDAVRVGKPIRARVYQGIRDANDTASTSIFEQAGMRAASSAPPTSFAEQVQRAAADAKGLGQKAFISDVYDRMVAQGYQGSLDDFKAALIDENRAGTLQLQRADLVGAMDPGDVARSEAKVDEATFHFIRKADAPADALAPSAITKRMTGNWTPEAKADSARLAEMLGAKPASQIENEIAKLELSEAQLANAREYIKAVRGHLAKKSGGLMRGDSRALSLDEVADEVDPWGKIHARKVRTSGKVYNEAGEEVDAKWFETASDEQMARAFPRLDSNYADVFEDYNDLIKMATMETDEAARSAILRDAAELEMQAIDASPNAFNKRLIEAREKLGLDAIKIAEHNLKRKGDRLVDMHPADLEFMVTGNRPEGYKPGGYREPKKAPAAAALAQKPGEAIEQAVEQAVSPPAPPPSLSPGIDPDLYDRAVEASIERGAGSVTFVQRKLGIGHARATAIVEEMTKNGIIAAPDEKNFRRLLVDAAPPTRPRQQTLEGFDLSDEGGAVDPMELSARPHGPLEGRLVDDAYEAIEVLGAFEEANANLVQHLGEHAPPKAAAMAAEYVAAVDAKAAKSAERMAMHLDEMAEAKLGSVADDAVPGSTADKVRKAEAELAGGGDTGSRAMDALGMVEVLQTMGVSVPDVDRLPVVGPLLGLYLKIRGARAMLSRLGGKLPATAEASIAKRAASTRDKVADSVDRLLGLGERAAGRIRQAAPRTAVLAASLWNDGQERSKPKDDAEAAAHRAAELRAAAGNPKATAKEIRRALSGLTDPSLIRAIEAVQMRKLMYLAKWAPKPPPPSLLGPKKWQPSRIEVERFARRVEAAQDPTKVFEAIANGTITIEAAETLREVYPLLYQEAQARLIERSAEIDQGLPIQTVARLSILFDAPLAPGFDRAAQGKLQQAHGDVNALNPTPPAPPAGDAPQLDKLYMSAADRGAIRRM